MIQHKSAEWLHSFNLLLLLKWKYNHMPTNKNAQLRYQIIDKCLSNWSRRYYIEDLVDACNEALYLYNGETKDGCGVKKRQVQEDLKFIIRKTKRCGFPKRKVSKIRKFQKRNVFYLFKHTKGRENQNNPFPCLLFYTFNSNRTSSLPPIRLIVLSMLFS